MGKNIFFEYNPSSKDQFKSFFVDKINELTRNKYKYYNTIEVDDYLKMYFNCSQSDCQSACFGLFDMSNGLGQIFKNRTEHNHIVEKNDDNANEDDDIDKEEDLSYLYKKSKVYIYIYSNLKLLLLIWNFVFIYNFLEW